MTFLAKAKAYSQEEFTAAFNALDFTKASWQPKMMVLHNTDKPSLSQWLDPDLTPDQRTTNLRNYYRNKLGLHSGPHWFVGPNAIWEFCDPLADGVHCSNANHFAFGVKLVGNYDKENFDEGPGAKVRDNAVHLIATVFNKMGWQPEPLVLWSSGLAFHSDCAEDNDPCPGKNIDRADLVARVVARMAQLRSPLGAGV